MVQAAGLAAAEFIPLGQHTAPGIELTPTAVSDGGRAVVGWAEGGDAIPSFDTLPFRWSVAGGLLIMDEFTTGLPRSRAHGVSADGSVVIGGGALNPGDDVTAFRWTVETGVVFLNGLNETHIIADANGISADGGTIAGIALKPEGGADAYRWTAESGITRLPRIWEDCGGGGGANGISGDGRVIVGASCRRNEEDMEASEAARWTEAEGVIGLGDLPGGGFGSHATAASHDGSVIVGGGLSEQGEEAVRWKDGQILGLGDLPGGDYNSVATGISGDGRIIIGDASTAESSEGFLWTEPMGMQNIRDVLAGQVPEAIEDWGIMRISGISRDGEWIVGEGINPEGEWEGYLARLDVEKLLTFTINAGLNDAWFNPATNGQGFFIIVFPDIPLIFLAWFTYDTERPDVSVTANLGDPGHRWITAQGPFEGDTASLDVVLTMGGVFDSGVPAPANSIIGAMEVIFEDCTRGVVKYDIPSLGLMGDVPIQRIANDNVALCEAMTSN